MSGSHMDENLPSLPQVNLEDIHMLEMSYSHASLGEGKLTVVYVGGRIKVFEVDRFLIERLLEQLEVRGA